MPPNIRSIGSAFIISPKGHRNPIQSFAISVRYDISHFESLTFVKPLHELNGPNSHDIRATVLANGIQSMMKQNTSDTLPVKVTANHAPREYSDLFVVHGPTA